MISFVQNSKKNVNRLYCKKCKLVYRKTDSKFLGSRVETSSVRKTDYKLAQGNIWGQTDMHIDSGDGVVSMRRSKLCKLYTFNMLDQLYVSCSYGLGFSYPSVLAYWVGEMAL